MQVQSFELDRSVVFLFDITIVSNIHLLYNTQSVINLYITIFIYVLNINRLGLNSNNNIILYIFLENIIGDLIMILLLTNTSIIDI